MAFAEEFTAALLADAALTDVVGPRIRWGRLAAKDVGPALVLHLISTPQDYHMRGRGRLSGWLIQMDCRGATFAEALAIREALLPDDGEGVLDRLPPPFRAAFVENTRGSDPQEALQVSGDPTIFTTSLDVRVWRKPA